MIREDRPWGWFQTIDQGSDYKVKKIFVNPNSRFSLQYHNYRDEYWTVVQGSGKFTLGDESKDAVTGDNFFIPVKHYHRMEANSEGLMFIEVQRGECREDDIVRISDDYGRD